MTVPAIIYAGDTVKFTQPATAEYSSSGGWTAAFALRHGTGNDALNITGVAEAGGGWDFTITAAQSANLHANGHYWQLTVTKAAERFTLGTGSLEVLANIPASGNTYDGRSQTEKDLEAVRDAMRARIAGGEVMEYTIGNRSLKKIPMPDLIALESKLKADLSLENRRKRIAAGQNSGRATFVRFQ